jgi:hypothetical protein
MSISGYDKRMQYIQRERIDTTFNVYTFEDQYYVFSYFEEAVNISSSLILKPESTAGPWNPVRLDVLHEDY